MILKSVFAAGCFLASLTIAGTTASALPANGAAGLGGSASVPLEQVQMTCDINGRCWGSLDRRAAAFATVMLMGAVTTVARALIGGTGTVVAMTTGATAIMIAAITVVGTAGKAQIDLMI